MVRLSASCVDRDDSICLFLSETEGLRSLIADDKLRRDFDDLGAHILCLSYRLVKMAHLHTDHRRDEYAKLNCFFVALFCTLKSPTWPAAADWILSEKSLSCPSSVAKISFEF